MLKKTKIGSLILYPRLDAPDSIGVVLYDNWLGGTLKVIDQEKGSALWVITSQCEVLNEGR